MIYIIAFISVASILLSLFLMWVWPAAAFYIFLIMDTFGVIAAYNVAAVGLSPISWTPGDFLCITTLIAAFLLPAPGEKDGIRTCLQIILLMVVLCTVQGMTLHFRESLYVTRELHFAPALFFALRYFTSVQRVWKFLQFSSWFVVFMFVVHVLVRFGFYQMPGSEELIGSQMGTERGGVACVPVLYIALLSIAIARLATRTGLMPVSIAYILVAVAGVALSETRTLYFVVVLAGLVALLFTRRRAMVLLGYCAGLGIVFWTAQLVGFDLFYRFRTKFGRGEIRQVKIEDLSFRVEEYGSLVRAYLGEFYFILTGRGIGAGHRVPSQVFVDLRYWHSEYLAWLDRFGIVGFTAFIILMALVLRRSYQLARSEIAPLGYFGTTVFILTMCALGNGLINPSFLGRQSGLLVCFLAIVANWQSLYAEATADNQSFSELGVEAVAGSYAGN